MKISKKTMDVLDSLKNICPSLYFDGTNEIAVKNIIRNQGRDTCINTVLAVAEIEEEFPEFGIYDSKQFLDVINTFKEPEIEFADTYCVISSGKSQIKYGYCSLEMLSIPKTKSFTESETIHNFVFDKQTIQETLKMGNLLKNEDVTLTGDGSKFIISLNREGGNNEYNIEVSDCNKEFVYYTKMRDLQIMQDTYTSTIILSNDMPLLALEGTNKSIKYWIALQEKD